MAKRKQVPIDAMPIHDAFLPRRLPMASVSPNDAAMMSGTK